MTKATLFVWILISVGLKAQQLSYPTQGLGKYTGDTLSISSSISYNTFNIRFTGGSWGQSQLSQVGNTRYSRLPFLQGQYDIFYSREADSVDLINVDRFQLLGEGIGVTLIDHLQGSDLFAFQSPDGRFGVADINDPIGNRGFQNADISTFVWSQDSFLLYSSTTTGEIFASAINISQPSQLPQFRSIIQTEEIVIDMLIDDSSQLIYALTADEVKIYQYQSGFISATPFSTIPLFENFNALENVDINGKEFILLAGPERKFTVYDPESRSITDLNLANSPTQEIIDISYYEDQNRLLVRYEDNLTTDLQILYLALSPSDRLTINQNDTPNLSFEKIDPTKEFLSGNLLVFLDLFGEQSIIKVYDLLTSSIYEFPLDQDNLILSLSPVNGKAIYGNKNGEIVTFWPEDLPYQEIIEAVSDTVSINLVEPVAEFPTAINFGDVCVLSIKDTIVNDAIKVNTLLDYQIDSITLISDDFEISANPPFTIAGGTAIDMDISFLPRQPAGIKTAQIIFHSLYGDKSIELIGNAINPNFDLLREDIDIGSIFIGDTLSDIYSVLRNSSPEPLVIESIMYDDRFINIDPEYDRSIGEGETLDLQIDIASDTDTLFQSEIIIFTEDFCSPIRLPVLSNIIGYNISIPDNIDLGILDCSTDSEFSLAVANNNNRTIGIDVSGSKYITIKQSGTISIIPFTGFDIVYSVPPLEEGIYTDTVLITHPPLNGGITLSQIEISFIVDSINTEVSDKQVRFQPPNFGDTDNRSLRIYNPNQKDIEFSLTLLDSEFFTLDNSSIVIDANDTADINILYLGNSAGTLDFTTLNIQPVDCGNGESVQLFVDYGDSDAVISIDDKTLDLGTCLAQKIDDNMIIRNTGTTDLLVSDISPADTQNALFEIKNDFPLLILPGNSQELGFYFTLINPDITELDLIISNNSAQANYDYTLKLNSDNILNYEIDDVELMGVSPNKDTLITLPVLNNAGSPVFQLSYFSREDSEISLSQGGEYQLIYTTPTVGSNILDTLILTEQACQIQDTILINGSTNMDFYLTTSLELNPNPDTLNLGDEAGLTLKLSNPFGLDLTPLETINLKFAYNDTLISLPKVNGIDNNNLTISGIELTQLISEGQIEFEVESGYTTSNTVTIDITEAEPIGIEDLTIMTSSTSFELSDKSVFPVTRTFGISYGADIRVLNLPIIDSELQMLLDMPESSDYTITLYDMFGKTIHQESIEGNQKDYLYNIFAGNLSNGIYLLELSSQNESVTKKISVF
jgi:hypothetical protein